MLHRDDEQVPISEIIDLMEDPVAGVSSPGQLTDFAQAAEYEIPARWMEQYLSLGVW